jgi:hypothetical protein
VYVTGPLVPPVVVTVTLTAPAAWAGVVAVMEVPPAFTTAPDAAVPPKDTLAPVRFAPVSVTAVPPAVVPEVGAMELSVGAGGGGVT